ncbi:MAG: addiction module toxin, HicA family [Methanosarcinales archaeon]|uniref:Addiction module toxin, HicA family n=1 Tax=Candidatus Ethanoperedens thermophilum TaxID=2766897 RepID=A0A848DA81_9EURY|nr:addiction module toxin, HicA family [Candidatus Ethanoperedens thermophilum]
MKLPRVVGDKVVRALKRRGFVEIRKRGSHYYLYHEQKDRLVSIPVHAGKIIAPKTLKSILKQAEMSVEEFKEVL